MKKKKSIRETDTPLQIAAKTQALADLGFNQSQISRELGISRNYVIRLLKEDLPEEWEAYRTKVRRWFFEQDTTLAEVTAQKLKEKITSGAGKVSELAFVYKTARELQFPQERQSLVNVDNRKIEVIVSDGANVNVLEDERELGAEVEPSV